MSAHLNFLAIRWGVHLLRRVSILIQHGKLLQFWSMTRACIVQFNSQRLVRMISLFGLDKLVHCPRESGLDGADWI